VKRQQLETVRSQISRDRDHCLGCLFGLAVECATARLDNWPNQLDRTGYESGAGCEIRSGAYAIGLISSAANKGLTVSSLICDHWLTRKLAMFMGSTDSLEC